MNESSRKLESLKRSSDFERTAIITWNGTSFLECGSTVVMAWAFYNYVMNFLPRTVDKNK